MNTAEYNRLQQAKERLEALGMTHITVTLELKKVVSLSTDVAATIADTMERVIKHYETLAS